MNMFDLTDRVALVSGTASGMGQAMATAFAEAGAHVMLLDVNTAGNEATAHTLSALGRRAIPVTCDVSKYDQLDRVYERLDKEFGRLDILGNVAGNGIQKARTSAWINSWACSRASCLAASTLPSRPDGAC